MLVVLPTPLTPTNIHTVGPATARLQLARGRAAEQHDQTRHATTRPPVRGRRPSRRSARARTSSMTFVVVGTPTSARISASSRSSQVSSSILPRPRDPGEGAGERGPGLAEPVAERGLDPLGGRRLGLDLRGLDDDIGVGASTSATVADDAGAPLRGRGWSPQVGSRSCRPGSDRRASTSPPTPRTTTSATIRTSTTISIERASLTGYRSLGDRPSGCRRAGMTLSGDADASGRAVGRRRRRAPTSPGSAVRGATRHCSSGSVFTPSRITTWSLVTLSTPRTSGCSSTSAENAGVGHDRFGRFLDRVGRGTRCRRRTRPGCRGPPATTAGSCCRRAGSHRSERARPLLRRRAGSSRAQAHALDGAGREVRRR